MKFSKVWIGLTLLVSGGVWISLERIGVAVDSGSDASDSSQSKFEPLANLEPTVALASGSKSFGEIIPIVSWRETDFQQVFVGINQEEILIIDMTFDPVTQVWSRVHYNGSTAYAIHAIESNGRDKFYVAGRAPNGDVVVEHWKLRVKFGSGSFGGGGGAPGPKTIKKSEIFRGPLNGPPADVQVDPEGRFMLLLSGDGSDRTLYSFILPASGPPSILKDVSSLPELEYVDSMDRFKHLSLGRIWELTGSEGPSGSQVIILIDSDNNGVFEDPPIVDYQEALLASGLYNLSDWIKLNRGTN